MLYQTSATSRGFLFIEPFGQYRQKLTAFYRLSICDADDLKNRDTLKTPNNFFQKT